ncbi:MAG: elongation factor G [Planctomycetaceae bacterium]|nr:MAG: elongation factor G [Planctomycetaceae bacterium]
MVKTHVEDIRNIVLVGHGASGKTTLADLMLAKGGAAPRAGSVDDGTSALDFDEEEKQHKYTITSSLVHFPYDGKSFTVIDTPGYPDFIGQAIGALQAVENAVIVINASAGIEVNTRKVFELAGDAGVKRMIVINKLDNDNVRFTELIAHIQESFGKTCVPVNVPSGVGAEFTSVLSALRVQDRVPASAPMPPAAISQVLMDAIVECDEKLMERYLEGETFTDDEIEHAVKHAIQAGTLIPIFCLSAKTGVGVPEFLAAISHEGLDPHDLPHSAKNGEAEVTLNPVDSAPFVGQVFKTRIDPFVSRMSFIRVHSGRIAKDTAIHSVRSGKATKISQLYRMQGSHEEPIDSAGPGEIVVINKVDDLQVGDTLTDGKAGQISLPRFRFPTPMIGLAVEPKSRNDQQKISSALHKIEEEDPTFQTVREAQTHELVMRGMSDLHLKIIEERLHRRDHVDIVTHPPKIPYRETVSGDHEGFYRHKKQSGGAGQFAEVHLRVSHLPQGLNIEEYANPHRFVHLREYRYNPATNYLFIDRVSGGSVPNQFIPAVEKGVLEQMEKGVLAGYQVQDVCVELFFGKDHPVDSNENAFRTAGAMCFKQEFLLAKPMLLEPIMHLEIHAPAEKSGEITRDLNGRRGRVEGMDTAPGGMQVISARAPLAEVTTYARGLQSTTGGRGSFTMDFAHYEMLPGNEQQKIIAAAAKHLHPDE